MTWEEAAELDSDDERVIGMHDGIRRILDKQKGAKPKDKANNVRDAKQILSCGRIVRVDVERRLVVITVEKLDGEIRQLRIEAVRD